MNDMKMAVEVKDLTVTFSRWGQNIKALDNVNLSIPAGQWVMLIGHNGSGKSTLLKAISGRLDRTYGEINIDGKRVESLRGSLMAERVFHVHQDPLIGTASKLTLFENLMVADHQGQAVGTSKSELLHKYRELLQPLGLADRMKQLARYFSGGERQLIALLIARLRPSSLMLLDEPLAALDPAKTDLCLEQIDLLHKAGRTIIQVTHDPRLASEVGNRTVALRDGGIVYDERAEDRNHKELHDLWYSRTEVPA